ncbi:MAG: SPOR domain-containing protein [Woeseiaceae bacterium]|jgi:cell division protein FtsN|nr:SPOR domain-containing protein [Woeseiaceae bacterium]
MAKRRKRSSSRQRKQKSYPGWLWMIFGLAIGLSVAFGIYVKDREPAAQVATTVKEPASMQSAIDKNSEVSATAAVEDKPIKDRFTFYDDLPASKMIIADEGPVVDEDVELVAIDEPGVYMLQAGAFSTRTDADRRRAVLALYGIESRVQRARVKNRDYFRVEIGPIEGLEELNMTSSQLRETKIDVMRIRLRD